MLQNESHYIQQNLCSWKKSWIVCISWNEKERKEYHSGEVENVNIPRDGGWLAGKCMCLNEIALPNSGRDDYVRENITDICM